MENNHLLTYLLFLPLFGSLLIIFIKKGNENFIRWFGFCISIAAFIISLMVYFQFDRLESGFQFIDKATWIKSLNVSTACFTYYLSYTSYIIIIVEEYK
jgi:NADH-quinone oxidoreductase subunit M